MTRGYKPVIAIGEAKRNAQARGQIILSLEPADNLPFHFVTFNRERISLVRVRRLKYPEYDIPAIEHSCRADIEMLRGLSVTRELFRELMVRGPDRTWHRYLVLPESLETLDRQDHPGSEVPEEGRNTSSLLLNNITGALP